jgi:subtilisin
MDRSMRPARLLLLVLALGGLVTAVASSPAVAVGTDPGLSQQWGLRQIGAPAAWSTSVGAGVPIAVIDTGIELGHEDLRDQIGAAVTCVGTGGDPAKCKVGGEDIAGHGSHVAGIAAAAANDAGISGVAPGARLIAVRVFTATESTDPVTGKKSTTYGANTDDINAGIRWTIRNVAGKGAINLSIGDDFPIALGSAGFADGVEEAWAAGWVPVLAAGNESNLFGLNGEEYGDLDAMVVGATGPDGEVADYSSPIGSAKWGLVAPGGNAHGSSDGKKGACQNEPARCVLSTYKGGQYGLLQGTSMATPHVAGAVALVMSAGLDNAAAVQRLLGAVDHTRDCGGGCKGRLDVAKAVAGLPAAGGGAATTAASAPGTAAPTTGAPASSSGAGVRRGTTTTAAPLAAAPVPDATAASGPGSDASTPPSTDPAPPPPDDDGVVGLSVAEAARRSSSSADEDHGVDGVPIGLAVLALAGAGATTLVAWRRRWGAAA